MSDPVIRLHHEPGTDAVILTVTWTPRSGRPREAIFQARADEEKVLARILTTAAMIADANDGGEVTP